MRRSSYEEWNRTDLSCCAKTEDDGADVMPVAGSSIYRLWKLGKSICLQ